MSLSDYKDTIHRVYIEEDRTLDDLMHFMNEEYSIVARDSSESGAFERTKSLTSGLGPIIVSRSGDPKRKPI
jgi:hypothetical protein